jgi:hypothetical protein
MPQISERRKIIESLEGYAIAKQITNNLDLENAEVFMDPAELLALVMSQRYIQPHIKVPKSYHWFKEILPNLDPLRFKQNMRVSQETFQVILKSIRNHAVFKNNSNNQQLMVEDQLSIAMWRFGRYGNGSSLMDISSRFGISEGMVNKATKTVIKAILSLQTKYLSWYSTEEKKK